MSTFSCEQKLVKTRKNHSCESCNRTIPKGKYAYHVGGMYEGSWQHWYQCRLCYQLDVIGKTAEHVNSEDFFTWLEDQDIARCPSCHRYYPDMEWSEDEEIVEFHCTCGNKWKKRFGFELKEVEEAK